VIAYFVEHWYWCILALAVILLGNNVIVPAIKRWRKSKGEK